MYRKYIYENPSCFEKLMIGGGTDFSQNRNLPEQSLSSLRILETLFELHESACSAPSNVEEVYWRHYPLSISPTSTWGNHIGRLAYLHVSQFTPVLQSRQIQLYSVHTVDEGVHKPLAWQGLGLQGVIPGKQND